MVILTEISQASSSSSDQRYDVFLSFRGVDTRLAFTDHLRKALVDANIHTFFDDDGIETGEDLKPELEQAIESSRASIIVLSKNYASSSWCLDELVLILDRHKTSDHIVFPIFYHVEPTDVRKQQNSFGDALKKHKQRMEAEKNAKKRSQLAHKLELWMKALTEVADLKGKDANGRRETELIEEIVMDINHRLPLHLRSDLPHLVGRDFNVKRITTWLKDGSSHTADILTISGMPGIGKTSLAYRVYRLRCREFDKCSFIEDVGRRCGEKYTGLFDLQKKLFDDISTRNAIQACDVSAYTSNIEKALSRKKVFIVLDGVDSVEQLDALLGNKGFHPGSKIIVTTNDRSLTEKCSLFNETVQPKHTNHLLKGLYEDESLRLLSLHAFLQDSPKEGYEEVFERLATYCGGHPLALEVLGRSLRREDVAECEDILRLLEKEVNPDIQKVLQISFDSLPSKNDKELFKHIACFFVGEDKDVVGAILNRCGIKTTIGFSRLINRCLITIGYRNQLMMHQLLQDMGRDLVRQESPEEPRKRSRLWEHEDCINVLKERKGTTKIQALVLDMKMFETHNTGRQKFGDNLFDNFRPSRLLQRICMFLSLIWWLFGWLLGKCSSFHHEKGGIETEAFSKMCNLRLLQLNYVQLNGSYKNLPNGLRWLCMHGSHLRCIPSNLQLEELVVLDMSYSNLQQLWKKPKLLPSLKFLNLSYCDKLVTVGHFSTLPALERVMLRGCASLVVVCESIGCCDRLAILNVSECKKLKNLPRSMGSLKRLKTLSIDGCASLDKFQIEIQYMKGVPRRFKAFTTSLPSSLVSLSLRNNNLSNKSFPEDFSSLSMLEELYLDGNPIDSLPDCVRSLTKLQRLSLDRCHTLKSLLCVPNTMIELIITDCRSLEKITFHPKISEQLLVDHSYSYSLTEIEGILKCQAVAEIDDDILCSLGWINLEYAKNQKLTKPNFGWSTTQVVPVQMTCYRGVFSIVFHGNNVPDWLIHRSNGSSILFTLQCSPKSCRVRGLNVCFVFKSSCPDICLFQRLRVSNLTKKFTWEHWPYTIGEVKINDEGLVWLCHLRFRNNEFEDGDEVNVMECGYGLVASGCGTSVVYDDGNKKEDPLAYYDSFPSVYITSWVNTEAV